MSRFSYGIQLIVLTGWVFAVGIIFTIISDKQVAGVVAGSGFIILPCALIFSELKSRQRHVLNIIGASVFLMFSALPIFLLRITNWGIEFKSLTLLGISADGLHRISNVLYLFMAVPVAISWYRERKARLTK